MTAERRNLLVSLAALALFVALFLWSQTIPNASGRQFPMLVSGTAILLCALDVAAHSGTALGRRIALVLSGSLAGPPERNYRVAREALAVLWVAIALGLVLLLGFLMAMPIYVLGYLLLHARRSLRHSLIAAFATTLGIWFAFEVLLRYDLYRGLLFSD
jgi:Tripartite tricarboxylate transporter TctB family